MRLICQKEPGAWSLSNQRGVSMIEVLLMSSVMLVMALSFASMMSSQSQGVAFLEDKLSRVALESNTRLFLSDAGFCKSLLEDVVAPKGKAVVDLEPALVRPSQVESLQKFLQKQKDYYSYDKLKMGRMTLENSGLSAPNSSGTIDVGFYPARLRTGGGPDQLQVVKMKVLVNVDKDYKITSCSLAETSQGGLGVGQVWTNMRASRACGVSYTNDTGKPIQVIIFNPDGAGSGTTATVGGLSFNIMSGYSGRTNMTGSVIVPNGTTYSIACSSSTPYGSSMQWTELR